VNRKKRRDGGQRQGEACRASPPHPHPPLSLSSDGVWDNLWPEELEAVVAAAGAASGGARDAAAAAATADAIVAAAAARGADPDYRSPWIVDAAAAGVLPFWARLRPRGGKPDDCTAVVAFVDAAVA